MTAYDAFAETAKFVIDTLFAGTEGPRIMRGEDQDRYINSPPYRRLVAAIDKLSDEERIDLLALGWFGAGLFPSWRRSIEHAEKTFAHWDPHYAAGYGRHWQAGYTRVTAKQAK